MASNCFKALSSSPESCGLASPFCVDRSLLTSLALFAGGSQAFVLKSRYQPPENGLNLLRLAVGKFQSEK